MRGPYHVSFFFDGARWFAEARGNRSRIVREPSRDKCNEVEPQWPSKRMGFRSSRSLARGIFPLLFKTVPGSGVSETKAENRYAISRRGISSVCTSHLCLILWPRNPVSNESQTHRSV